MRRTYNTAYVCCNGARVKGETYTDNIHLNYFVNGKCYHFTPLEMAYRAAAILQEHDTRNGHNNYYTIRPEVTK